MQKTLLYIFFCGAIFWSCMDDDEWLKQNTDDTPLFNGVFITNEGNFMYDNASLSYYDIEKHQNYNHVFFNKNTVPLGDVAQSMIIHNGRGYIVVNNSGKIYVMDVHNYELVGKITGFTTPRYMHFVNDTTAYVTDLYAKAVAIVNTNTLEITGYINVDNHHPKFYQHSTEQMVRYKNFVFVNCWSHDNKILVIDSENHEWVDSIEVLKQPNSMVMDKNNNLWVLCDGGFEGSPYGHGKPGLLRIDAATRKIEHTIAFDLNDEPRQLQINGTGDTLYFINNHVYRHAIQDGNNPVQFIESPYGSNAVGGYYALGVDPVRSEVYVADAIDHVQQGMVYRYTPQGAVVDSFRVGIIPGSFCFH